MIRVCRVFSLNRIKCKQNHSMIMNLCITASKESTKDMNNKSETNVEQPKNSTTNKKERAKRLMENASVSKNNSSSRDRTTYYFIGSVLFLTSFVVYDINSHPNGYFGTLVTESGVKDTITSFLLPIFGYYRAFVEPQTDSILPDWGDPFVYGNIPPGTPAPPLLVLDLEKTLIASTYDAKYGWRHVKRPGLDKFINILRNYYEIVIISENDLGVVQDVLMAIDPDGACHKHGSSVLEMKGMKLLKRLDRMNREMSRIILIDDNPESFELCSRNTLQVKPFLDINDRTDSTLTDLIPLLLALVHDDVKDFRATFDALGTHDASEAATEYHMRLSEKKKQEMMKRNKGIGGLIRGQKENLSSADESPFAVKSSILSPSEIAGSSSNPVSITPPVFTPINTTHPFSNGSPSVGSGVPLKKESKLREWMKQSEEQKKMKDQKWREEAMKQQMSRQQRAMDD